MNRRKFLAASAGAAAITAAAKAANISQEPSSNAAGREYYELRRYHVHSGWQQKTTDAFLRDALVPAANRLGISTVGVFNVEIGATAPCIHVLLPAASVESLATLEQKLGQDAEYMKAGAPFLAATADQPAIERIDSWLMVAFEGHPKLTLPAASKERKERIFELRTYESPSDQDHRRKVEMFNSGEFGVFQQAGFWQMFYGDVLVGERLPCLTYMIGFNNLADRAAAWSAFSASPDWKKLNTSPRFAFESIVSNITNTILRPTAYSQI